MNGLTRGSLRLGHVAGINVFVHWSWAVVAYIQIVYLNHLISSLFWSVALYLSLFGIVLLHEFGHALACRQVGGTANRIVLWPLGGVAFVSPPLRPGACLWSIAAGPLVNLVLLPITFGLYFGTTAVLGWHANTDLEHYLLLIALLNLGLLVFNLLPIYPLDGGQILHTLLWFFLGRGRSLLVASCLGLLGGVALSVAAWQLAGWWLGIMAAFIALRSWVGVQQAWSLLYPQPGMALLEQASEHLQNGDFAQALVACDRALELLGENRVARANLFFRRGLAYRGLGEKDQAIADFSTALVPVRSAAIYLARAETYLACGDATLAQADLNEVLRSDPWSAAAFFLRGNAHLQQGLYEQAIDDYSQALRLNPRLAVAWANRASAHQHLGQQAQAGADYQEAVKLGFVLPPQPDV